MGCRRIFLVGKRAQYHPQLRSLFPDAVDYLDIDAQQVVSQANADPPDVILLDVGAESGDSLDLIRRLNDILPTTVIIGLSDGDDPHRIAQAIHFGARDCYSTQMVPESLRAAVEACLGARPQDQDEGTNAPSEVEEIDSDVFYVAASPVMKRLRRELSCVARVDTSVLFLGESGSGKEVAARLVHVLSSRAGRCFLKVNCAALPAELLESELFGYQRGAFTGAVNSKPGRFELCQGGTILLDEIGEMPRELQAKLLHVLQDHSFTRLGGCNKIHVDVRVLAATNIDVKQAIAEKHFRVDLYYRLNTFVIRVPPLRERVEDINILLSRFLGRYALQLGVPQRTVPQSVMKDCCKYPWPGNVRELQSFAKRYLVLGEDALPWLDSGSASPCAELDSCGNGSAFIGDLKGRVRDLKDSAERVAILDALERTHWNRREAARLLNISYKSILSKIRQYGLDPPQGRMPPLRELGGEAAAIRVVAGKHPVRRAGAGAKSLTAEAGCPK